MLNTRAFNTVDDTDIHAWGTESDGGDDSSITQQDGIKVKAFFLLLAQRLVH